MEGKELLELIGLIYDAVLDSEAWPVMLNRLTDALSARCGFIGSHNSSTNATAMTAPRTDPECLRRYTEYWASRAFLWKGLAKLPAGTVMVREMIISRDEFCHTDYYDEWCKPLGVEAVIATNLLVEGPLSTVIAAYRPYAEGDFDATETGLFAALIPHLQRAVQLQLRLAGLDGLPECSAEILNRLLQGVILVDGSGDLRKPSGREHAAGRPRSDSRARWFAGQNPRRNPAVAPHCRRLRRTAPGVRRRGRASAAFPGAPPAPDRPRRAAPFPLRLYRCRPPTSDAVHYRSRGKRPCPPTSIARGFRVDARRSRGCGRDIGSRRAAGYGVPAGDLIGDSPHAPCSRVRQDRHAAASGARPPCSAKPTGGPRGSASGPKIAIV